MKITFNGAARDVTGSQFLVEVNGSAFLLDCGLYQGHRADTYQRNQNFRFDPAKLDAVILSHAHIDHCGNLPNLVKKGFRGPIYTTSATAALTAIMLKDSAHIQEADAQYVTKKNARRGEPPVEPLYTIADAIAVEEYFHPFTYGQSFSPVNGVRVHLEDAGHILGSAGIILDVEEGNQNFRFQFSGDIGRKNLPLIQDPVYPSGVQTLMMECTYGDTPKTDPREYHDQLRQVVQRTFDRGGRVIVPSFALGRTQELIFAFNQMVSDGEISPFPVYVDSPLALETTRVFESFPEYLDRETKDFERTERHPALEFKQLRMVQSVDESKALNDKKGPMVIISASGMAENGRILHHLRNNIENPRNTILIVGWQAPDTLGRRLVEQQKVVRIFGQIYERRAEVMTINAFSAHAGQDTLLEYAVASSDTLKKVILVHGEKDAADAFKAKLAEKGITNVLYPDLYETIDL
jgi:metallo-beta-lactamase family protein